ncbi:hypothetical protein DRQ25_13505 [Candidatus Fermentibacteria bacterium]|nr:MAG: hypothetical protein DRQ25_13505 [Candidatus Fermentibacteria bacterium]
MAEKLFYYTKNYLDLIPGPKPIMTLRIEEVIKNHIPAKYITVINARTGESYSRLSKYGRTLAKEALNVI